MIEIAFPDQPANEAGILAQELAQALRTEGAPDSALTLLKERPETMDLGTGLAIAEMAVGAAVMIKHLFDLWHRAHCTLRITTPRGRFVLRASEIDVGKLNQILGDFFRGDHSS
jgi:hypothetical protein